jgi:hypothetical protein
VTRKIQKAKPALFLVLLVVASASQAELPLTVEDLITDPGTFKLETTLTYANSERTGFSTGEPILVQTGPTSFISLPTAISETQRNTDSLVGTLGLRFGLSSRAELYARGSYLYNRHRSSEVSLTNSANESRFADAWFGINYKFKDDDEVPAVLGFVETAVHEKHSDSSASFKSLLMGLTTYRAIDPVVFSLTAGYRFNRSRNNGGVEYRPGDLLLLNPSVALAVNDRVTLTGGLQWTSRRSDQTEGQDQAFRRTSTDLLFGVGYGVAQGSTFNIIIKASASGRNWADLRINWLHML